MKTYSMDLRQRVVDACDGKTETRAQKTAKRFKVSVSWIQKLLLLRRVKGSIAAKPHGGGRQAKFQGEAILKLQKLIEERSDATLQELLDEIGTDASIMAIARALERLGYRHKKSRYGQRSKIAPTSNCDVKRGAKK